MTKVVILAGGRGTRLREETYMRPKPMVHIGGKPILWHILKHYAHYGFKDFYIAVGYLGYQIKQYFMEYYYMNRDMSINLKSGQIEIQEKDIEDWLVNLIDTGLETNTGGRVKRLQPYLSDGTFMVTYGDGVSNIDIDKLLKFHREQGKLVTISAVRPPARFGGLLFEGDLVSKFTEKPQAGEGWINGGFIVCEPGVFDYLEGDHSSFEHDMLERAAKDSQLAAYRHYDFWQCMDTVRELELLEALWASSPPWKIWS